MPFLQSRVWDEGRKSIFLSGTRIFVDALLFQDYQAWNCTRLFFVNVSILVVVELAVFPIYLVPFESLVRKCVVCLWLVTSLLMKMKRESDDYDALNCETVTDHPVHKYRISGGASMG